MMADWCPENDGAYRAELAARHRESLEEKVVRLTAERDMLREALEYFATWDHCWPGNINLEVACNKARAALASIKEADHD